MELIFLLLKGLLFGILTSIPIGGTATLIVRESYFKGKIHASALVAIPLFIDWVSALAFLFLIEPKRNLFLGWLYPWMRTVVHFAFHHFNAIIGCVLLEIGIRLWRNRYKVESGNASRLKIGRVALVNVITISSALLGYFSTIFQQSVPLVFGKYLFIESMMLGGLATWHVTLSRVESSRKKNADFDPHTANAKFAKAVLFFATLAFAAELFQDIKHLL